MPISHDKKLIFIHIPKTAGTSIEKALDLHHIENFFSFKRCHESMPHIVDLFSGSEKNRVYATTPQHLTASQLKVVLGKTFDEYEKFAVVRNPYDRMVSEYHYTQTNPNQRLNEFKRISFAKFVRKALQLPEMVRHSLFDSHLNTQCSFLHDSLGFSLVENVFKFESLIDVFNRYNLKLLHERKSNRKPFIEYLDDDSKRLINDAYAIDFETFGYPKY